MYMDTAFEQDDIESAARVMIFILRESGMDDETIETGMAERYDNLIHNAEGMKKALAKILGTPSGQ